MILTTVFRAMGDEEFLSFEVCSFEHDIGTLEGNNIINYMSQLWEERVDDIMNMHKIIEHKGMIE